MLFHSYKFWRFEWQQTIWNGTSHFRSASYPKCTEEFMDDELIRATEYGDVKRTWKNGCDRQTVERLIQNAEQNFSLIGVTVFQLQTLSSSRIIEVKAPIVQISIINQLLLASAFWKLLEYPGMVLQLGHHNWRWRPQFRDCLSAGRRVRSIEFSVGKWKVLFPMHLYDRHKNFLKGAFLDNLKRHSLWITRSFRLGLSFVFWSK